MNRIDAEYRALVRRVAERVGQLPGVHHIAIGGRERAGAPTGELVIKVFVEKKRPETELRRSEVIPREVEGMATDVVETGRFTMSAAPGAAPIPEQEAYKKGDFDRYRPIRGGTQLKSDGGPAEMPGTLGFLARVQGDPKRIMAVSCYHVLYTSAVFERDRKCGQPNTKESSTKCCHNKIGVCKFGHYDPDIDAALVQLDAGQEWLAEIHQIGFVKGPHTISAVEAQTGTYQVRKRGRTLRLTGGTVQSVVGAGAIPAKDDMPARTHHDTIVIKPNPSDVTVTSWFAQEGDSGAALVNEQNEVCGIVFGRNDQGWGLAQATDALINKFRTDDAITLEVATATQLGQTQVVPKATAEDASAGDIEFPAALRRLQRDLDASERGRELISVWLEHSQELNQLVHHQPRVAATWRQANGPELFRLVIDLVDAPTRPMPHEIRGVKAEHVLDEFLRELERYASPGLRHDLDRHRPLLAELPGRSYDDLVRQLH